MKYAKYLGTLLLLALTFFLIRWAQDNPALLDYYYSQRFGADVIHLISGLTAIVPFAVAEVLIFVFGAVLFFKALLSLRHIKLLIRFLLNAACYGVVLYFLFVVLWGLNYYRLPLYKLMGIEHIVSAGFTVAELADTTEWLAESAIALRRNLDVDEYGVMALSLNLRETSRQSVAGFEQLDLHFIRNSPRPAKPIFFSSFLSRAGIAGFYFPFTAEGTFNRDMPDFLVPVIIAHEQAHQLGIAREDEANFIAFLACINHPCYEFQYSGFMLAFMHASNALFSASPAAHAEMMSALSDPEGIMRDNQANWEFWRRYEGRISEINQEINDRYLRAHGQEDGVRSYGRMVDLVLAYRILGFN